MGCLFVCAIGNGHHFSWGEAQYMIPAYLISFAFPYAY